MKWALLATLAALPLQWFVVGHTALGVGRVHQLAILAFAGVFFCRYRPDSVLPLRRELGVFLGANIVMLTVWSLTQMYNGQLPLGPVQEFLYLAVFLSIGTMFFRSGMGREGRAVEVLRWSAAAAAISVLVALAYSMVKNGVNPANVFVQTVSTGNPEIFQKELFKSAFTGFGFDDATVRGNIRHEVFGAVLCAMYVSGWAARYRPFVSRGLHALYQLSMLLGTVLLAMSLSRSILLAAAVWPLLSLFRAVRAFRVSGRQLVLGYLAMGVAALVVVSGFGLVIWNRFTQDTGSYQARQALYTNAFSELKSHFLTGGADTLGSSSHNFVVDSLLRGGIFVAIPALAVVLSILWTWLKLVSNLHRVPDYLVPVAAAFALPLVRLATSGGGLINPVEWVTLGFIAGVLAVSRAQSRRQTATPLSQTEQPVPVAAG